MKMEVISYLDLFGENDYISCCEEDVLVKDGIKYLPLDAVYAVDFHYETKDIQEVEFE